MTEETQVETDPFGRRIIMEGFEWPPASALLPKPSEAIAKTIARPAMLIEIKNPGQLYFYRSVNWQHTLLVGVQLFGNEWKVFSCTQNPSSTELSDLLKRGKQLI